VIALPGMDLRRAALLTRLARLKIARERKADGNGPLEKSEHGKLLSLYREYVDGHEGKEDPVSFACWRTNTGVSVRCPKCGLVNAGPYKVCGSCVKKAQRSDVAYAAATYNGDRETDL
jgi:hypothetical protein